MAGKAISVLLVILLILIGTLLFSMTNVYITGNTVAEDFSYSHTKAVCNSTNYCVDYEIRCDSRGIVSMSPITGSAIQFDLDWKDPRNKEDIERVC